LSTRWLLWFRLRLGADDRRKPQSIAPVVVELGEVADGVGGGGLVLAGVFLVVESDHFVPHQSELGAVISAIAERGAEISDSVSSSP